VREQTVECGAAEYPAACDAAEGDGPAKGDRMSAKIRFALQLSNQNIPWNDYLAAIKVADELAFETFWSFDHLMPIGGDMDGSCHECYATMAAFAAATKRIRIGALVSGSAYRNPAMTLKLATQIDVISNGRFDFGIGAGWAEREFKAFNLPFATPKERIGGLKEMLDLAKLVWTGDPTKKVSYAGKYVQATDLFINPQPVQRPRPPILIGGGGEQLTLRVVARHADMWHGFGDGETLKHKLGIIDNYARGYGRDPKEIIRSTSASIFVGEPTAEQLARATGGRRPPSIISGTPAAIEARLRETIDLGVTYFMVNSPLGVDFDNWRRVSEQIIPRFA
jgi:alkanesulfonate monooxygenase SsuD/methylene tetrahydromethanopterin reductase-like flavin-dependent oxidoreductase (luciferase family)